MIEFDYVGIILRRRQQKYCLVLMFALLLHVSLNQILENQESIVFSARDRQELGAIPFSPV